MRIFWKTVLIFIGVSLFIILWWILQPTSWLSERRTAEQHQLTQPKDLKVSLAYELDERKWVTFPLAFNSDVVKVISNAVIPVEYKPVIDERWIYAIEYELLDAQNKLVLAGEIYHRTGQRIFYDKVLEQEYVSASFFSAEFNPVDTRLHIINFRGYAQPVKIRLREKYKQQPIVGMVVRAYDKEIIAEHKLKYLWQRMGDVKREYLSKASVYDQGLLSNEEQLLIMKNQWNPLGPSGVDKNDYVSKKLYMVRDIDEEEIISMSVIPPEGLLVYPGKYGVVKIPTFSGRVKISWQAVETGINNSKVSVEWWGHPSMRYNKWHSDLKSAGFTKKLDSGVLQLSASTPIVFKVWINADTHADEITPKINYTRLYQSQKESVTYRVNHKNTLSTPFKVDLRTYLITGEDEVEYRLLDAKNQTVKSGLLTVAAKVSVYDTVVGDKLRAISNPTSYFFNLPSSISSIELYTSNTSLVSAYNRPPDLPLKRAYPYKQANAINQTSSVPTWYFLRPDNWKSYVAAARSILLSVQSRPPDIDPLLMAGQYRWDQFLPEGNWRGRELLTSHDEELPAREQSLGSRYTQMPTATDKLVEFQGYTGESSISPQMMYLQTQANALNIKIWLNNKLYFNDVVFAASGEISLPPVAPGEYTVKVVTDKPARILVDHVVDQTKVFQKRMAIKLDKKRLNFSYLKEHDEELIAVRVYTNKEDDLPQNIQFNISDSYSRGVGPYKSWTIVDMQYDLSKTDGPGAQLLQSKNQALAPSRLFFVKLGDDLPNGKKYRINIKLNSGPDGFVTLTRTIPGVFDSRVIRSEKTITE